MKTQLVQRENNQAYTTSLVIADNCPTERKGIEFKRTNKSVVDLIKKYESDFLLHGQIDFENLFNPQGKDTVIAHLNEDQATFLITLFTNTKQVVAFKSRLVKEFRNALNEINRLYSEPQRAIAIKSKRAAHLPMMDALKELRLDQGKETRDDNYMCESKLCNFIVLGRFIGVNAIGGEDVLTNDQVIMLDKVRKLNESLLLLGMDYVERKKRLVEYGVKYRTKLIAGCKEQQLIDN